MSPLGRTRLTLLATATALMVALPAGAAQAAKPDAGAAATGISVGVKGKSRVDLLKKVTVAGQLANPTPNDNVQLTVSASGRELFSKKLSPKGDGSFEMPIEVNACCRYLVEAENAGKRATASFTVDVPKHLGKGGATSLFNRSLQDQGFHTGTKGSRVTIGTRLAIKAFRKTNGMGRSEAYRPAIFRKLLMGQGAFKPEHDEGRHVEVDISRQVMSLIEGDTAVHTFHVSTGTVRDPHGARQIQLLHEAGRLQLEAHVLLGLLHPGLRHPRLQPRPELQRQPRLRSQPDPVQPLHLQLDPDRDADLRLRVAPSSRG